MCEVRRQKETERGKRSKKVRNENDTPIEKVISGCGDDNLAERSKVEFILELYT